MMYMVGTVHHNVNNILSQCPAVLIAKCPVDIRIVPHIMVSTDAK